MLDGMVLALVCGEGIGSLCLDDNVNNHQNSCWALNICPLDPWSWDTGCSGSGWHDGRRDGSDLSIAGLTNLASATSPLYSNASNAQG
jgi:hypothetical protein